jgi:hypothetical protein
MYPTASSLSTNFITWSAWADAYQEGYFVGRIDSFGLYGFVLNDLQAQLVYSSNAASVGFQPGFFFPGPFLKLTCLELNVFGSHPSFLKPPAFLAHLLMAQLRHVAQWELFPFLSALCHDLLSCEQLKTELTTTIFMIWLFAVPCWNVFLQDVSLAKATSGCMQSLQLTCNILAVFQSYHVPFVPNRQIRHQSCRGK